MEEAGAVEVQRQVQQYGALMDAQRLQIDSLQIKEAQRRDLEVQRQMRQFEVLLDAQRSWKFREAGLPPQMVRRVPPPQMVRRVLRISNLRATADEPNCR